MQPVIADIRCSRKVDLRTNSHCADFATVETITFNVRFPVFLVLNQAPLRPGFGEMRAACIDEVLDQAARARFVVSD